MEKYRKIPRLSFLGGIYKLIDRYTINNPQIISSPINILFSFDNLPYPHFNI